MPIEVLHDLRARLRRLAEQAPARTRPAPGADAPISDRSRLTTAIAREIFESQLASRHIDLEAYELRARGEGFHTISGTGHEANAILGRLTTPADPALLHYRSGGFFVERARYAPEIDPIEAVLLGVVASSEDPISGGRHKVFGSMRLGIPPQTSTIGSHLPKAVGMALSLERAHRLRIEPKLGDLALARDSIVVCSFGDASINHASSTTALNAARWVAYQGLPLPVLFVCEDNGLGISVRTPSGWCERVLGSLAPIESFSADGSDLPSAFETAARAVEACRARRAPVTLHIQCVRLLGHAGSDVDSAYRTNDERERAIERDPVLATARLLLERGVLDGTELLALDDAICKRAEDMARRAVARPKLTSAAEVMEPIAPSSPERVREEARRSDYGDARERIFGSASQLPESQRAQPLGRMIAWALHDLCAKYPNAVVFGEDVAEKGGVYNVTAGLWKRFGPARVFNTLLDETTILALAQGAGQLGLLPVPEIQYLAFLHNAEDQLRGEAAMTSFYSRGQLRSPMVVRVAGYGYQKGFGGHFHNDNSLAVLRDIPGIVIATPSRADDAVAMLRTLFASAAIDGTVCVFLEPIALYPVRDLYEPNDAGWSFAFPAPGRAIDVGEVGVHDPDAQDLTIVTYANGVRMALRAARRIAVERGARARVVDLRWLRPLDEAAVLEHARATGKLLVLDECRRAGNVGESIAAAVACDPSMRGVAVELVTSRDSFVPLGAAAELVLASEDDVVHAAQRLLGA